MLDARCHGVMSKLNFAKKVRYNLKKLKAGNKLVIQTWTNATFSPETYHWDTSDRRAWIVSSLLVNIEMDEISRNIMFTLAAQIDDTLITLHHPHVGLPLQPPLLQTSLRAASKAAISSMLSNKSHRPNNFGICGSVSFIKKNIRLTLVYH